MTRIAIERTAAGAAKMGVRSGDNIATSVTEIVSRGKAWRRGARYDPASQALCRTRTDDPLLTMEVLYQLS